MANKCVKDFPLQTQNGDDHEHHMADGRSQHHMASGRSQRHMASVRGQKQHAWEDVSCAILGSC